VPFMVLPFDKLLPAWPPAPVDEPELPPEPWAMAELPVQSIAVKTIAANLTAFSLGCLRKPSSEIIAGDHRSN
jgi:hypothetical protein